MIDVTSLDLVEVWSAGDPGQRAHFDTANEIDCVLEGTVEWELGGRRESYGAGSLVQIPAKQRHIVRNGGDETARLLVYLDQAKDIATFDEPLMPIQTSVVES